MKINTLIKKYVRISLTLFFIIPLFAGCSGSMNNGIHATDNNWFSDQYCFVKNTMPGCTMTSSATGYYFFSGRGNQYLYYMDKDTLKSAALCNKPDCLHSDEPDPSKWINCNAFFGGSQLISVASLIYYDKSLYLYATEFVNHETSLKLIKMAPDGTKRIEVLTFKDVPTVLMFHQGYFYYATSDYGTIAGKEDSTISKSKIFRIAIDQFNKDPELIYEVDGINAIITNVVGYNNLIFFSCSSFADSQLQRKNKTLASYNLSTKTESVISQNAGHFAICGDKIVYYHDGSDYMCNLDGSNNRLLTNVVGVPASDDRFIITDTSSMAGMLNDAQGDPIKSSLNVYDLNGKKLQSFDTAEMGGGILLGSDSDYIILKDESAKNNFGPIDTLCVIDKSQISAGKATIRRVFEYAPKFQSQ